MPVNRRLYSIRKSFSYAIQGMAFCVLYEKNIRIHIVVMLYMLYFSDFYVLTRAEFIGLLLTCVLVIVLEMVNTAIEVVVDKISPGYHTLAKIAKDVAAGAVLLAAAAAVVIGFILFWDTVVFAEIWEYYIENPMRIVLFGLSLVLSIIFIFSVKERKGKAKRQLRDEKETGQKNDK